MSATARARQLAFEAAERRVLESLKGNAEERPSPRPPARGARGRRGAVRASRSPLAWPSRTRRRCSRTSTSCRSRCWRSSSARGPGCSRRRWRSGWCSPWSVIQTGAPGRARVHSARGSAAGDRRGGGPLLRPAARRHRRAPARAAPSRRCTPISSSAPTAASRRASSGSRRSPRSPAPSVVRPISSGSCALILAHGREIVTARSLLVYLPDGDELVAVTRDGRSADPRSSEDPQLRLPLRGSLAGQVLLSGRPRRVTARTGRAGSIS